ncbi:hypothetical protein JCM15519_38700 [Fundidesulfovibrio butyratiphilus]
MNPGLTKTYVAQGDVPARAIVKAGSEPGTVAVATASTDAIIGVSERLAVADGDRVDIIHSGIVEVVAGGTIAFGEYFTASNAGVAVAASPAAGVNARVGGVTLQSATTTGDIIDTLLIPIRVQG